MIVECNDRQKTIIKDYIGNQYYKCLYLYMNLERYGMNSNLTRVYLQQNSGRIQAILLKYYSCLHIFSKTNDFNVLELESFFSTEELSMIYCERQTAEYIWNNFSGNIRINTDITFGWVAEIRETDSSNFTDVQLAKADDFRQIVSMIYEDEDIGRSYNLEELSNQLEERAAEGYTRNYVIKHKNTVIAHACTNAEIADIAVVAELVVNKNYRRKGYASHILKNLCGKLILEGKQVFSFYYSAESRALHQKIGFYEVCEWAKIVKRKL